MSASSAVSLLPHPYRIGAAQPGFLNDLRTMFGREWPVIRQFLGNESLTLPEIGWQLSRHEPMLESFNLLALGSSSAPGNTEQGGFYGLLAWLRQQEFPAPVFRFTDELAHLLELTDIADDIPLSCLALPYPRFYLELGQARELETAVPNVLSGDHVLEGAYVEAGWHHELGDCIYVTLTGSPVGKTGPVDDATLSLILDKSDIDAPLVEVIQTAFDREHKVAREHGFTQSPDSFLPASVAAMRLVVKALLYLNLPEARRVARTPRTELEKKLGQLKSGAKRAKLERRTGPVYDFIEVSAPPVESKEPSPEGSGRPGVRAHWRRGHYRMQAHGPQYSLRKLTFIRPMLVGSLQGADPAAPNYRVR